MRPTRAQTLQQQARYTVGATVEVYTIFDGWQPCQITRLGWDSMFGRIDYHVALCSAPTRHWITSEQNMREATNGDA